MVAPVKFKPTNLASPFIKSCCNLAAEGGAAGGAGGAGAAKGGAEGGGGGACTANATGGCTAGATFLDAPRLEARLEAARLEALFGLDFLEVVFLRAFEVGGPRGGRGGGNLGLAACFWTAKAAGTGPGAGAAGGMAMGGGRTFVAKTPGAATKAAGPATIAGA